MKCRRGHVQFRTILSTCFDGEIKSALKSVDLRSLIVGRGAVRRVLYEHGTVCVVINGGGNDDDDSTGFLFLLLVSMMECSMSRVCIVACHSRKASRTSRS